MKINLFNKITFSLYQKLAITLTLFVFCLMFLMYYLSQKTILQTQLYSQQMIHFDLAKQMVKQNPELQSDEFNYELLNKIFQSQKLLGPTFDFYLLDVSGNIKAQATNDDLIKKNKINIKPINQLLKRKIQLPIFAEDPKSNNAHKIFSAAPIFYKSSKFLNQTPDLKGYMYIVIGSETIHPSPTNTFSKELIFAIGILIMLLAFLLFIFSYFTKPLRKLTKQANNIWLDNDFNNLELLQWKNPKNNEIHQLGQSVNQMINRIQTQFNQLQQIDIKRKTMLAEIAHDLRTPLSSMSGYLELLKTQENLENNKKNEYLDVVIRNNNILKGFIEQIFQLAYLESGEVSINKVKFSLNELLGDIVSKYQIAIKQKNIQVSMNDHNQQYNLNCDIEKLERLISNIFENAIRHTNENGVIKFEISSNKDQFSISVCDNGTGIEQDEINKIFDPRYRASNAVGNKNKNIGLGLSISQKLVQLLGGTISVESQLGKGSTFCMTFPKELIQ